MPDAGQVSRLWSERQRGGGPGVSFVPSFRCPLTMVTRHFLHSCPERAVLRPAPSPHMQMRPRERDSSRPQTQTPASSETVVPARSGAGLLRLEMLQTLCSAVCTRECMHTLHAQGQLQPKPPSWLQGMSVETNVLPAPVPAPPGLTPGGQRPLLGAEVALLAALASGSGGTHTV